jgi:uncharacterized damage-inducible protein DinB
MVVVDAQGRTEAPNAADEAATLVGFLEFQRATFAWKTDGLDAAGLQTRVAASSMTLGGMLKHLALVEDGWFSQCLEGKEHGPPWNDVDWDADPDWEWRTAADDTPEELRALWRHYVDSSRENVARALAHGDPGQLAKRTTPGAETPSLRWILCHMIEEYARHNGHADLIREAIDGQTGE